MSAKVTLFASLAALACSVYALFWGDDTALGVAWLGVSIGWGAHSRLTRDRDR